jgi:Family of unknown function (DUF6111)
MLRIILTVLLPIALPLILYFYYVKFMRARHGPGTAGRPSLLGMWLVVGTAVVLIAGMLTLGFSRGVPPGTKLISPHVENGKVIPSQRLDQAQ